MSDTEDTIRALEDARYAAMIAGDFAAFAAHAHPDMVYTHSTGIVDTLDSFREKVESGYYVYHRIDHPVDRILVVGDTAVVVGQMLADITAGGTDKRLANLCTATWVRDGGRWLLLAYAPTVLPAGVR